MTATFQTTSLAPKKTRRRQLTGRGDESYLRADHPFAALAEGAHLDDVRAALGKRKRGGRVDGASHLVVAAALLLE